MAANFCIISLFYVPGMFSFVGTHERLECECEECEDPHYADPSDGCLQLLQSAAPPLRACHHVSVEVQVLYSEPEEGVGNVSVC